METALEKRAHGNEKYPWSKWGNGETWTAKRGIDFHCQVGSFRALLANKVGIEAVCPAHHVTASIDGDTVTFRFVPWSEVVEDWDGICKNSYHSHCGEKVI